MTTPRRNVLVVGLPGVGKTTLIERYVSQHPEWVRVAGGALLRLNGMQGHPPEDEEEAYQQQLVIAQTYRDVRKQHKARNVLFDGHCLIKLSNDYDHYTVPEEILERMAFDGLVVVDAEPFDIMAHRKRDAEVRKDRDLHEPYWMLERQREDMLDACERYAQDLKLSFGFVYNATAENFAGVLD